MNFRIERSEDYSYFNEILKVAKPRFSGDHYVQKELTKEYCDKLGFIFLKCYELNDKPVGFCFYFDQGNGFCSLHFYLTIRGINVVNLGKIVLKHIFDLGYDVITTANIVHCGSILIRAGFTFDGLSCHNDTVGGKKAYLRHYSISREEFAKSH